MKRIHRMLALLLLVGVFILGASAFAAAPYEIKWYFIGNGQQPDVKLIEDAASKYIQKKGLRATLKLQCYTWGDEYDNRLRTIIASGEPYDICFTASWANLYKVNVARGAFLDITDLWKKYAPKSRAQLHPAFISGSAIDGRNYAIPANKELAHQWGFWINKNFIDKYKFDISSIKTLKDIEPMLKVIKEKEPGIIPFQNLGNENAMRILDYDRFADDYIPAALYNDSKDMKVFNLLETKEFKDYLELARKWYQAGYVPADAATVTEFVTDIKAGKVFSKIESLKPFADEERAASWGIPCVQVELTNPVVQTRDCTGSMQAISKTSKNPALALRFLELFNTDKYLNNLINFGIQGKHYVKVSANVIDYAPGVTAQNSGYKPGTPWMFGNQYLNYFWKGENQKKWDAFKKFNASSTSAKSLGFNFDSTPVRNEVSACMNVWISGVQPLVCGAADPKTLPDVIARFKAAGIDKIIAEAQKQLNEWQAKSKKK
ncbi:carbohydrate ABC transporter substrate-binding protein (CUT1 family) [Hydrogenispora ethanolica]|jgi:putative aldouronate transport system substrate-binding protein|uniref:Carbohydrate ABC transporter substrate-binding protein (CUT1 family) n=1 Tax=Hydrogenispora ethanolica TaxID=1082276 RepID=A0A4V2QF02_HYDET|nr:ABC transporter substrate-binding protein [Hydrogenispora ethanolica]TCL70027.1 carbohydrate ABC transporter substrate-binding protein (CUT1 family) [Hydrogenispora ethanolica]